MIRAARFPISFEAHTMRKVLAIIALTGATAVPSAGQSFLGPQFAVFADSLLSAPVEARQAMADSFLNVVAPTPHVESDTVAYFLYAGDAGSVALAGDMNGWNPNVDRLTRFEGTNLWYFEAVFEPDARLDYKLVVGGSDWILDPRNPATVVGGFGANSELSMPAYVQRPEIERYDEIEHGAIVDHRGFESALLGDTRMIRVYLPPGYESSGDRRYGLMVFHDGLEYFSIGRARNVLDYLISEGRIDPIIGVFVPPNRREDEYGFALANTYERFIIDELLPFIDATYRTSTNPAVRGTIGASLGGLISAQLCYRNPEQLGLCAPVSPSFQVNGGALSDEITTGPKKAIRFYVDWGTYEPVIEFAAETFVAGISDRGYDHVAMAWFEGHSWGSWRAHLSNALEYFFPPGTGTGSVHEIPETETGLGVSFPNPFTSETQIPFSLATAGEVKLTVFDALGRSVWRTAASYPAGDHSLRVPGEKLVNGQYLYRLETSHGSFAGAMALVR